MVPNHLQRKKSRHNPPKINLAAYWTAISCTSPNVDASSSTNYFLQWTASLAHDYQGYNTVLHYNSSLDGFRNFIITNWIRSTDGLWLATGCQLPKASNDGLPDGTFRTSSSTRLRHATVTTLRNATLTTIWNASLVAWLQYASPRLRLATLTRLSRSSPS